MGKNRLPPGIKVTPTHRSRSFMILCRISIRMYGIEHYICLGGEACTREINKREVRSVCINVMIYVASPILAALPLCGFDILAVRQIIAVEFNFPLRRP